MKQEESDKAYIHWLYQTVGMGNRKLFRTLMSVGTPVEIHDMACKKKLSEILGKTYTAKAKKLEEAAEYFDVMGEYGRLADRGIQLVAAGEKAYPAKLAVIPDAPCVIYYAGRLPNDDRKTIALIGARNCSEYGKSMARQFGEMLAGAGVQVVSGMARGIDGIGQQAALDAGGYSLGVLGCGVDVCYPPDNKMLYERLIKQGGICSEYPPGIEPRAMLFPPRNRIISGLCDGVLVVEAKEHSGTLITVDMALEQGREVYALPGRVTDALSRGCNRLIRQGAAIIVSPQELLQELNSDGETVVPCRQQKLPVPKGVQGQIYRLLDFQPISMESLQRKYVNEYNDSITISDLCYELLQLCADGFADQVSTNYYVRKG